MADRNSPPSPPAARPRAPTITIDTAVEEPPHNSAESSQQSQPQSPQINEPPNLTQAASHDLRAGGAAQLPGLHIQTSFDSKRSLPTSPHNVSSPTHSINRDGDHPFLEVPGNRRAKDDSIDSADVPPSISSQGNMTAVTSNTASDQAKKTPRNEVIMHDTSALDPDVGTEHLFHVDNNPFAFTPGQLVKMYDPKSLAAFYRLGGLEGLEKGLRTDRKAGLSIDEQRLDGRVSFEEATGEASLDAAAPAAPTAETTPLSLPRAATAAASGSAKQFEDRLRVFHDNRIPERKGKNLLQLMWLTMQDKVLVLLSVAAVVSLAVGLYQALSQKPRSGRRAAGDDGPSIEWVEGVAIMVAIAIVVLVGSLVDWSKERRFAKLNQKKQDRFVKAIRSGNTTEVSVYDLMPGDVVYIEPGDMIPADGVLIEGFNVTCDESQATGESDLIRKRSGDDVFYAIQNNEELKKMDPFIQSGARVTEGAGTYLVTCTGVHSSYGKILMSLNDEPEMTPLQHKLNVIAIWIAKFGTAAASLLFVVLFIKFCVRLPKLGPDVTPAEKGQMFIDIFLVVVTIIVVAVPEGLPLAVTLALAYAMVRMVKDNNLVRHLKACEVMGNATCICSDKTGTLTQNVMHVVAGTFGVHHRFGGVLGEGEARSASASDNGGDDAKSPQKCVSQLSEATRCILIESIALNSTAFEGEQDGEMRFIGSKTETALLLFARDLAGMGPVQELREGATTLQLLPFDSGRKAMGVVVKLPDGGARLYVKGASEIILGKCGSMLGDPTKDASTTRMDPEDMKSVSALIDQYASRSLRTIGVAYRDFSSWPPREGRRSENNPAEVDMESLFEDLTFIAMVGIQDPLRAGVPESVALCQKAGVTVRMVTGDNKLTAQAIARECGILQPGGVVMEGPEFRNLSRQQQEEVAPRLQVLARSSPEDKRILVRLLRDRNEIVAVTGDGTNDAPALKTADVGFSMGQSGTEVAKEASSIILMDDNFVSIVSALKWGRAVNDAVKRFLQFQLTVNVTALTLAFVTAVSSDDEESVLTAVQLLWVNLIMDTLAALALATDPPQHSILDRKPEPRTASIITTCMWKMILGQAMYQLLITFLLYYGGPNGVLPLDYQPSSKEISTLVFNTFVWMQIFNQWNNRRLDNNLNIFEGILQNPYFIAISTLISGAQVIIIFFGGAAFSISSDGQSGAMWGIALVLGFISIPVGVLIRFVPDSFVSALVPGFVKRRVAASAAASSSSSSSPASPDGKTPGLKVSDEELGRLYPEPLLELRDELKFMRRMRGGRLNQLTFAVRHPAEVMLPRSRSNASRSRSRSNSVQPPATLNDNDGAHDAGESGGAEAPSSTTPEPRRSRSMRSRSNSALGAPTVMAGIVAAGVAAGWSPVSQQHQGQWPTSPSSYSNKGID
ncbi:P-type Ca2+ transporter type 2C [Geosmithia morbida]|uniref:Calcium-transporting ATPase n=1 Tax=Geosmithia morbida TaxID=1094350 RepID=A0A9P5D1W2_9HYPO|nr:P-type Ca2+ transporter type 2C [Geosmithia morbida]KAF4124368.1 P-type Ca2+ transporter type 2C [Geosmithia morbida]